MAFESRHVHILTTGGTIANPPEKDGFVPGEALKKIISESTSDIEISITDPKGIDLTYPSSRSTSRLSGPSSIISRP